MQPARQPNPYVGPRPFENTPEDIARFFGRQREARDIYSLVIAERAVLLFGQSGTGKTSLLNAALIPMFEKADRKFEALIPARVQGQLPIDDNGNLVINSSIQNIYMYNAIRGWSSQPDSQALTSISLANFLESRPRPSDIDEDFPLRIVIFDQFEELFTAYQSDRWADREAFFKQVTDALTNDPLLRVLFVMREDFIGELVPYELLLHGRLATRYRLERLRRVPALDAIVGPVEKTKRHYIGGAAEYLVDKLIRAENITPPAGTEEFVEPVILQVVCSRLWEELPSNEIEFTPAYIEKFQPAQALQAFYKECVDAAVSLLTAYASETEKFMQGGSQIEQAEETIREWFEKTLLTPAGTRNMVRQGPTETSGLANNVVDILQNKHIIRPVESYRGRDRWFELAHDRFIDAIQKSNEAWRFRRQEIKAVQQQLRADKIESATVKPRADIRVFLSYSRYDNDFVIHLHESFAATGMSVWVDWEDIPLSAEWKQEIRAGIESSDCLIAILSPDYLMSTLCHEEMTHARQCNKRIIPVVRQDFDTHQLVAEWVERGILEEATANVDFIRRINWLYMREGEDFEAAFAKLIYAINLDLEYLKQHTLLTTRALEWKRAKRDPSYFLRGSELKAAVSWLTHSETHDPQPTSLQKEYITASLLTTKRSQRARWLSVAAIFAALIGVTISVFAYITSENNAKQHQQTLEAQEATRAEQTGIALTQFARSTGTFIAQQNQMTQTAFSVTGTAQVRQFENTLTAVANQNLETQIAVFETLEAFVPSPTAIGPTPLPQQQTATAIIGNATGTAAAALGTNVVITPYQSGPTSISPQQTALTMLGTSIAGTQFPFLPTLDAQLVTVTAILADITSTVAFHETVIAATMKAQIEEEDTVWSGEFYETGSYQQLLGQIANAVESYRQALVLDPTNRFAFYALNSILYYEWIYEKHSSTQLKR